MISKLKRVLYFPVASYFRFFANIRLRRWDPKILVVTGSSGKTTLLHLLEAQIGDKAKYSHHANSSFGIPFDILDIKRRSLLKSEWIGLFFKAPINAFKSSPKEKIYIVEADCDRPGEGKFLASFLRPSIVLWVSVSKTHAMNFDHLVSSGKFKNVEDAIAYEFGYFLEYCLELAAIDGDSLLMKNQMDRTHAKIEQILKANSLKEYSVSSEGTAYKIDDKEYLFKLLLPEEAFNQIKMCKLATEYLDLPFDNKFTNFILPPGRSSIFKGIKNTTLIDSTYNADLSSMQAILSMFDKFESSKKWFVIADILEQGKGEDKEHEKLADLLMKYRAQRIILLGPRTKKNTYPKLKNLLDNRIPVESFENPREVLDFILSNIKGDEVILFKGVRFMEGIIEQLLANKEDVKKLPRREEIWEKRRKQWGL